MKVGMTIEPFQAEWVPDYSSSSNGSWGGTKGNIVVSFFGTEIYSSPLVDEVYEYTLDDVTSLAMAEFGNLLAERIDKRIKIGEYGVSVDNE